MNDSDLKSCPFCVFLGEIKLRDELHSKDGYENKYCAALVHESYYNGSYCGRSTYNPEPLNYCSVCGIKIETEI